VNKELKHLEAPPPLGRRPRRTLGLTRQQRFLLEVRLQLLLLESWLYEEKETGKQLIVVMKRTMLLLTKWRLTMIKMPGTR